MSSACLGGNRPYLLDLELVKSARASQTSSSSPSSTLSESSNSPLAVSTRKPRAPRKRPNQTYNEAATILSTAYPHVFSIKHLPNASTFHKCNSVADSLLFRDADSLLPFGAFDESVFLARHLPHRDAVLIGSRERNTCYSSCSVVGTSGDNCEGLEDEVSDFDAGSMLEEEVEDGIEGIFGKMTVCSDRFDDDFRIKALVSCWDYAFCPNPIGLRLGGRSQSGMKTAFRLRNSTDSPIVDVLDIFPEPKLDSNLSSKKVALTKGEKRKSKTKEESKQKSDLSSPLRLKLTYDDVLTAWSGRGSPFPGDVAARLEEIDLFTGNEGARDASVSRYKEKRRSRFFSKKIRYQVRKVNADQRPRIKGRFVRKPNNGISRGTRTTGLII